MERQPVIGRLGEAVARVVFGPKIEGTVELVLRDPHNRNYWHILVETTGGQKRHFTLYGAAVTYAPEEGFGTEGMPYVRGQHFEARIRGVGLIIAPWSKIERDPFNLGFHKTG